jgi:hypothetical protein
VTGNLHDHASFYPRLKTPRKGLILPATPLHSATSSLAPHGSALRVPSVHVAAALLLWAFMWVLLPTWFEPVPPSDNIEQLVWSQGLELGYHKHPPLPTWILIGAEQILPASVALTYALSILGMGVGGFFLWRLAAQLLGRSAALPVVLATACIAFYSHRAHIYNHNTVLVPCVYAAAWFFLSAVRSNKLSQWVLLGAACAAGLLTKYQFVVILATFVLIAARLQLYRQPQVLRGAAIAAATCSALLAPHIWWLCTNDFPPFHYASQMLLAHLPPLERADISAGFFLQQLRDVLAPILMLLIAAALSRRAKQEVATHPEDGEVQSASHYVQAGSRTWIMMLGLAPIGLMLVLGIAGGVRLENHWGTTALQFVVLPLAAWMKERRTVPAIEPSVAIFLLVQALHASYAVVQDERERHASLDEGRLRAFDPASFSAAALSDWRSATAAPLLYVVGPTTLAGFVSLYSRDHPQVMIGSDTRAAPWVSTDKLHRCGGIYIDPARPPKGAPVIRRGQLLAVDYGKAREGKPVRLGWSIVPPSGACHFATQAGAALLARVP